jgi:hypothetical protein
MTSATWRRRWPVLAAVLTLAGAVAAVAFVAGRPGPDLEHLRADPLARWVPPHAALTGGHELESGTSLGMPLYAGITRVFRVQDVQAALAAAEDTAEQHGWAVEYKHTDSFTAYRYVPDWRLKLSVVHARVDGVPGNFFVYLAAYPA